MITPADLAHMLGQTPNAAGNHTQDQLLYTSQTPQNSADLEDSSPAVSNDEQQPVAPTPATVFGMKATVTIATPNETIAGQTDGIAAEAGAETMASIAIAASAAPAPPIETAAPTPATVFGRKFTGSPTTEAPQNASESFISVDSAGNQDAAHTVADGPSASVTADAESAEHTKAPLSAAAAMRAIAAATLHFTAPTAQSDAEPAATPSTDSPVSPTAPEPTVPEAATAPVIPTPADVLRAVSNAAQSAKQTTAQSTAAPAVAPTVPTGPTPAMMPQKRTSDGPTTFASLDAQELPVVREYSAGGLIFDNQNRVAIIARHSRSGHLEWCLPKGHIEKGETPQQTAVREVHEETGILGEVIDSIATIDYWFTGTTQRVHKLVHHFALRQTGGELTVEGDPDHEAEDAIWVRFDDLDDVLSYPNERKIAWLYARKKNRQANE
ncbi:NUDIX domain-containing protein [Bifidobacterium imperatoris]|uniref:NUDIX domain-containing protein n=2 Tax=Bifidobacterium imperatoris TaxID=2020965 RepID=A0A2N5IS42_9BIFI|nr:NUDIX domain-containing protein [Bifidobacterium imperatoris]PLS24757.1 Phosphohydrolase (MutT/nudix family protein) [Bifidobacterium imperatoris]QSY58341.1 NUDIX domain-containing protein [Bifidobacterium imperatoris]